LVFVVLPEVAAAAGIAAVAARATAATAPISVERRDERVFRAVRIGGFPSPLIVELEAAPLDDTPESRRMVSLPSRVGSGSPERRFGGLPTYPAAARSHDGSSKRLSCTADGIPVLGPDGAGTGAGEYGVHPGNRFSTVALGPLLADSLRFTALVPPKGWDVMEQMQPSRQRPPGSARPRIPAVQCGVGATGRRLDRHLAVLGAPAGSQIDSAEAASLIRELTPRGVNLGPERPGPRQLWDAPPASAAASAAPVGAVPTVDAPAAGTELNAGMSRRARIARVSLLAPLRKLRRTLFGGR
jgi:hypothetical protein